jgi:hypothetical protein
MLSEAASPEAHPGMGSPVSEGFFARPPLQSPAVAETRSRMIRGLALVAGLLLPQASHGTALPSILQSFNVAATEVSRRAYE